MGIDISMAMGAGVHIPHDIISKWENTVDPEGEYGVYELMEDLVAEYPGVSFSWVGNAWLGEEYGVVLWANSGHSYFDMGREAKAGVYEPAGRAITLAERNTLSEISVRIAGESLPVKGYVTVTVS